MGVNETAFRRDTQMLLALTGAKQKYVTRPDTAANHMAQAQRIQRSRQPVLRLTAQVVIGGHTDLIAGAAHRKRSQTDAVKPDTRQPPLRTKRRADAVPGRRHHA